METTKIKWRHNGSNLLNYREKLAISISFLLLAAGIIYTHWSGEMYPGLPAGAGSAVIILLLLVILESETSIYYFVYLVLIGIIYRVYAFLFPASLISLDPDAYAVRGLIVASTGSTDKLIGSFYDVASVFSVFNAETIIVAGLAADDAMIAIPLLAALIFPISAAAVAHRITEDKKTTLLAVGITVLAPATIKFSIRPVPIMFGALLFSAYVVALVSIGERKYSARWSIMILLLASMIFTHKIVVLISLGVSVLLLIGTYRPLGTTFERSHTRTAYIFVLVTGFALSIQWLFLTEYFASASLFFAGIYTDVLTTGVSESTTWSAAVPYSPTLIDGLIALGYGLTTLLTGGLVWLYLFRTERHNPTIARVLAATAVTVGISIPGLFIDASAGFQRTIFYSTAALGALIPVGGLISEREYGKPAQFLFTVAIILILVSQPISVAMTPDYRNQPRQYLTQGEVDAKRFATSNSGLVHMDAYYQDEVVNFDAAAADAGPEFQNQVPQPTRPGLMEEELLNATLVSRGHSHVLLRTKVEAYRMSGGRWFLTWDPVEVMGQSQEYHQTYSNGHANLYVRRTR